MAMERIAPGIWKVTQGTPEEFVATTFNQEKVKVDGLNRLSASETPPFFAEAISFKTTRRGCLIELPLGQKEQIFGFGLHLQSFNATNTRKAMFVNDHQADDDGSSHAPVPFYVSTAGYGVLVDTLRNAKFYCGNLAPAGQGAIAFAQDQRKNTIATTTDELYKRRELDQKRMRIEIPLARGVDIYLFAGPTMMHAVQRYNLFSGGGCVPPMWGLGMWYRGFGQYNSADVLKLARDFRDRHLPCDVFGLEPGWQSEAYSCSYTWSPKRWPDPDAFIADIRAMGYELNLWEHAFTHPTAPFYEAIKPHSGDYDVWRGLVPDFTQPQARQLFGEHHGKQLVDKGISGFKLDECDDQPHKAEPWSFPPFSQFPSGLDGEQMHLLFGLEYARTLAQLFSDRNIRTYGKTRASGALAASSPFVLYSDWYQHADFVRGILNAGFCGLLWQPEVRTADSLDDLYHRLGTAVCSPQAVINAWFLPHPTWHQIDETKNKAGELLPDRDEVEQKVRKIFEFRMSLIPYLYTAFSEYRSSGRPPFRALVMDNPADEKLWNLDNQYMMGDSLLVAPKFAAAKTRVVYLPHHTDWYCFWSHRKYPGGAEYNVELPPEKIPLFVKSGTLLPLAKPMQHFKPVSTFELTVMIFGPPAADFILYEDDGVSLDFAQGKQNRVTLSWSQVQSGHLKREGGFQGERHFVQEWIVVT